jgi:hypothetical protein
LTSFSTLGLFNITSIYPGNENYTSSYETYWVNVSDLGYPQITIVSPLNASDSTSNSISVNYTVSDENLGSCWWNLNSGDNTSISCTENISYSWSEGWNVVRVYANDTYGFVNSSIVYFFVDSVPPLITINSPLNQTYTSVSTEFNVNTSEISSCRYSLDEGTNVSMPTTDSLNFEKTNTSMSQGGHNCTFYCNDTLGNMNSTSVYFTISVSSGETEQPASGNTGGGGGGGGATQAVSEAGSAEIELNEEEVSLDLSFNSDKKKKVMITNVGDSIGSVKISQEGLDGIVTFSDTSFELAPLEQREIELVFTSHETPGVYVGKIIVNDKEILIMVNVKSELLLFDAMINIPSEDKQIKITEKLDSQVTLIPMGEQPRLDVTLNYVIKDFSGKTYLTESETILVDSQKTFKKSFNTDNLPRGDYVLALELIYPNGVATSSSNFEVVDGWPINLQAIAIGILAGIIISMVLVIVMSIRYKKHKQLIISKRKIK